MNFGSDFAINSIEFTKHTVMKNTSIALISALGGALVGSAITLLLTPHTGEEMREKVKDFIRKEGDKLHEEIERIRCKCTDITPEDAAE